MMMSRFAPVSVVSIALILCSCDKAAMPIDQDMPVAVQAIEVSSSNGLTSFSAGESLQLTANVLPANATNPTVTWSISDPTTALINAAGEVTGLIGGIVTAKATANDGSGISGSLTLTIQVEPNGDPLALYKKIYGATSIYQDGDYVVIKSEDLPDHKSPYYLGTQWESALYEDYNGTNNKFNLNPNRIKKQNMTFKIPLNPTPASTAQPTPLGAIGISLNGVPFYNQYAGPNNQALTFEVNSFDQANGHPQQSGQYHYHWEPLYLTSNFGEDALLGFLLDGYPVYGPMENGQIVTNAQLDAYHGHAHATPEFPQGTYHYHITDQDPYINGSGFYGIPGTVTN